jgi:hypothetical protein
MRFDNERSLQKKGGYKRRIARSQFGCFCSHNEKWRSTWTKITQSSHTSCKVHWGWRWDFRTFIVNCNRFVIYTSNYIKIKLTFTVSLYLYIQKTLSRYPFRIRHVFIRTFFSQWPILSSPKILTFSHESPCIWTICSSIHKKNSTFFGHSVYVFHESRYSLTAVISAN